MKIFWRCGFLLPLLFRPNLSRALHRVGRKEEVHLILTTRRQMLHAYLTEGIGDAGFVRGKVELFHPAYMLVRIFAMYSGGLSQ